MRTRYKLNDSRGQLKLAIGINLVPKTPPIPMGQYSLILIDPPWQYELRESDKSHRGRTPYPTMTDEQILSLQIELIAADDSYLMLWTTKDHLHLGFHCIEKWGFKYHNIIPWIKTTKAGDKVRFGVGHYGRNCSEFLLIATKGSPGTFMSLGLTDEAAVIFEPPTTHSTKPIKGYQLAERLHAAMISQGIVGEKIELFARNQREGWISWGAELIQSEENYDDSTNP